MPVPVISTTTSALSFGVGQDFMFQPSATNSPVSWAISGGLLPPGVLFSTQSGVFQGSGSIVGVYNILVTATNSDGESTPVEFIFAFFNVPLASYMKNATVNLTTLAVTCEDGSSQGASISFDSFAKYGDDLIWNLKFLSGGNEANPRIAMVKFGIRKDDESPLLMVSDPTSYKNGMVLEGGLYYPQHLVHMPLMGDELLNVVMENLSPTGTQADCVGEFQIDFVSPTNASGPLVNRVTTKTFKIRIQRDIADSLTDA